jgi:hypothetical protein
MWCGKGGKEKGVSSVAARELIQPGPEGGGVLRGHVGVVVLGYKTRHRLGAIIEKHPPLFYSNNYHVSTIQRRISSLDSRDVQP